MDMVLKFNKKRAFIKALFLVLCFSFSSVQAVEFYYKDERHVPLLRDIPEATPGAVCAVIIKGKLGRGFMVSCDMENVKSSLDDNNFIWFKTSEDYYVQLYAIRKMKSLGYSLITCSDAYTKNTRCFFEATSSE